MNRYGGVEARAGVPAQPARRSGTIVQLFGLEFTSDHARLAGSLLGALLAVGGFVAGRLSSYRQRSRLEREDLVSTSIVVEMVSVNTEGGLEILTASRTTSLNDFFQNDVLVSEIRKAASKHPGLLHLHDPAAHRLMMVEAGNWLQGLNVQANLEFIAGRHTDVHEVLIGFAAYPAGVPGAGHLHDEVDRLILMVVNRAAAGALQAVSANEPVKGAAHVPKRIVDLAAEWDRTRNGSGSDVSHGLVWPLNLRLSVSPHAKPALSGQTKRNPSSPVT
jgi:hypothetical protein